MAAIVSAPFREAIHVVLQSTDDSVLHSEAVGEAAVNDPGQRCDHATKNTEDAENPRDRNYELRSGVRFHFS